MTSPTTFASALDAQLRRDPARPFATFYDHDTGERVELSLTTYANWVAKTAGLVQDELDGRRGGLALVDLPTHWLGAVWLGAAWTAGLVVTDDPALAEEVDLVVCGPDGVAAYAVLADRVPVVALSLRPLGGRFTEALPDGVVDYGAVVLAQPDAFTSYDPPTGADPGWRDSEGTTDQSALIAQAEASTLVATGGRLLTDVNPVGRHGHATVLAPLVHGGGCVWVRHVDPARWAALVEQERVSDQLRSR